MNQLPESLRSLCIRIVGIDDSDEVDLDNYILQMLFIKRRKDPGNFLSSVLSADSRLIADKVDVGNDLLTDPMCLIFTVDDWNVTESVSASEDGFVEDTEIKPCHHACSCK